MASVQEIDPSSGYCRQTKTFHSLRPPVSLPSPTQPLSITDYILYLNHLSTASSPSTPFLVDSPTGHIITYPHFILRYKTLAANLHNSFPTLSKNDVAFILAPSSLDVPLLYFALLSLGVTICPANPLSTPSELNHMVQLTKPVIAFSTSSTSEKLPNLPLGTVLLDSPEFQSMSTMRKGSEERKTKVDQSDRAMILFSSGTTGRVKAVELTHRNLIAVVAGTYYIQKPIPKPIDPVLLLFLPLFHVFGLVLLLKTAAIGEKIVVMERFDFAKMLAAVERYKVTYMSVSPPLVVALAKSDLAVKYDLGSLWLLACGGAPLGKEVVDSFAARFPAIEVIQVGAFMF